METQKEKIEEETKNPNVLVLKFSGRSALIFKLLADLPKIVPEDSMYTSQLLKNKGIPGHHLFCKITFPPSNKTEPEETQK